MFAALSALLFGLLASRNPNQRERAACLGLLGAMTARFSKSSKAALALLGTGDSPRDAKLDTAAQAAWTQVAATVLASDISILLY